MTPGSRRESAEVQLARLRDIGRHASSVEGQAELKRALGATSNRVVARAAQIAGNDRLATLLPDLEAAFDRMMINPVKTDPGCLAKLAIVKALSAMDAAADGVFLAAARHRQPEPAFGEPIDTGAELRAAAIVALAQASHPKALEEAVQLLVDKEPRARLGAVSALATAASSSSALVLRLKALLGDEEPQITEESLKALLEIEADAVPFVASFLVSESVAVAKAAALAIGQVRPAGALAALRDAFEGRDDEGLRETVIVSIAMLRDEESIDFLSGIVREGITTDALRVLAALSMYAEDDRVRQKLEKAARAHINPRILATFWELFPRR
jgi:HEAT repeat protein